LKDVHDFIQYAIVQVQKIVLGQDLSKTFAVFLGFTALFGLMKVASPFSLVVLGLTSLYIIPLINSPQRRAVAQDVTAHGKELVKAATEKGNTLAEDGKAKAAAVSSKARETTGGMQQRVGNLAESGKQTANDLSDQANDCITDISQATAENAESLKDVGIDATNKASSIVKPSSSDAEKYIYTSTSSTLDGGSGDYRYDSRGAENNSSQFSSGIYDTPRQMAPHGNTVKTTHYPNTALKNQDNVASSMSG
jgi:uncharacterized protein YoxC